MEIRREIAAVKSNSEFRVVGGRSRPEDLWAVVGGELH